jgi:SAM-dependent methyltransferase
MVQKNEHIKEIVKNKYGRIALESSSCCCGSGCCGNDIQDPGQISSSLGYSEADLNVVPDSNLGLGCGNPGALGKIKKGDVVLDLGSGAGLDAFIASRKVGTTGKVIGVDFTEEMIKKARNNAKKNGFSNVEFKLGDIEDLPVVSSSVDVILSNCVINLVPDKAKAFKEAFRVLRPGGQICLSDMVLLAELTEEERADEDLISGCVGGAVLRDEYLKLIVDAGFQLVSVTDDVSIAKKQYQGRPVESIKIVAKKRARKRTL